MKGIKLNIYPIIYILCLYSFKRFLININLKYSEAFTHFGKIAD